jgi:CheY-like chemotaxis protein
MAKDFIDKWKKGETVIGYEDDQQPTEGKMILERMASIMTADQINKKKNQVETNLDKPSSNSFGSSGNSESSVHVVSLELQTTDDLSTVKSSGHEIPSPKEEDTFNFDQSEINKIKDKSESHNREPIPEESITAPSTSIKKKESPVILVVEDEPVTQRLLKKILEDRGYGVVIAGDGIDALMELGKGDFDLILSDLSMPNLDGFKLLDFMNMKGIKSPIIFLTGSDDVEDEIKVLALGAKDYIRKPINRDLLLLRIRKALDK